MHKKEEQPFDVPLGPAWMRVAAVLALELDRPNFAFSGDLIDTDS
jgi:hypothetical protein